MCLPKRMMKGMNEESAEQREEVLGMARRVQQGCARFKLGIASWLALIKLIRVRSGPWPVQACS